MIKSKRILFAFSELLTLNSELYIIDVANVLASRPNRRLSVPSGPGPKLSRALEVWPNALEPKSIPLLYVSNDPAPKPLREREVPRKPLCEPLAASLSQP
jgi:hypothetical protein